MKKTILIIDDSEERQSELRCGIGEIYDIIEACDYSEAERVLEDRADIKLIILNIIAPDMKNALLFDYLGEHMSLKIPVIVSTTFDTLDDVMRKVSGRATDFIAVPFNMDVVRIRTDNVLRIYESIEGSVEAIERQKMLEQKKFELLLSNSDLRYWEYNIKTKQLYRSGKVIDEVGYGTYMDNVPDVFIDSGIAVAETLSEYKRLYNDVQNGKDSYAVFKFKNEDGTVDWMEISYTVTFDGEGNPDKAIGIGRNVTSVMRERRESETAKNTLLLVRELVGAETLADAFERVLSHIAQYYDADRSYIFRLTDDNYIPKDIYYRYRNDPEQYSKILVSGDIDVLRCHRDYWLNLLSDREYVYMHGDEVYAGTELTYAFPKDQNVPDELLTVPIIVDGQLIAMMGVDNPHRYNDDPYLLTSSVYFIAGEIIKRRNVARMEYELTHDDLTHIYNRQKFYSAVTELLKNDPEGEYEIIYFNIYHFKVINDLFGREKGDAVLRKFAQKLAKKFYNIGIYARLDMDNFTVCIPRSMYTAEELEELVNTWFDDFNIDYHLTAYAGVYQINNKSVPVNLMCDRAKLAIETVKGHYKKRSAYYDAKIRAGILNETQISAQMEDALANGEFVCYLQPIFDPITNKPISAEALVRWLHPKNGLIPPNLFIPLFERNGFIKQVDAYIWEEVCKMIRRRMDKGIPVVPVSVNVSRINFYSDDFCDTVINLVEKYQIPVSYLRLEITETAYAEDSHQLLAAMDKLKAYGFCFMMDDFGSGYSSLNMIKDVPVDIIKLDMAFTRDIEQSNKVRVLINLIVKMAREFGMSVTAEGVETENQKDFLVDTGCRSIQGYYYSKPLPMDQFETLMDSQSMEDMQIS